MTYKDDPRLNKPLPEDQIARIRRYAHDLAWGALKGYWGFSFSSGNDGKITIHGSEDLYHYNTQKWGKHIPDAFSLAIMGYLSDQRGTFVLTEKSLLLPEEIPQASVFISYRRAESSALALLIVARMQAAGMSPFLDMKPYSPDDGHTNRLQPGDDWEPRLKEEIESRDDFIVLIGPTSLSSLHVLKEIRWAKEANKRIIPVWHNGFNEHHLGTIKLRLDIQTFLNSVINTRNAIKVEGENPKQYNAAIVELLNCFGIIAL